MRYKDDSQLVDQLHLNNTQAFDVLFRRYNGKVYRFALKFNLSQADAEEIVQEAFCGIWENRANIDSGKKFESYLFGIARNQIHSFLRKKMLFIKYLDYFENDTLQQATDPYDDLQYVELKQFLSRYIRMLPPRRREIFELSRFDRLTYQQIAKKLNISENTVDTQIRHALNFLKNNLKINS